MVAIITDTRKRYEAVIHRLSLDPKDTVHIGSYTRFSGFTPDFCVYVEPILNYQWMKDEWVSIREHCYSHGIPIMRFDTEEGM